MVFSAALAAQQQTAPRGGLAEAAFERADGVRPRRLEPVRVPACGAAARIVPCPLSGCSGVGRTRSSIPPHAFWDRTNLLLFSGVAVFRGLDYASTRNMQARGRREILLADEVVNNSAGFASLEAAGTLTSVGISYLLHRQGRHKLERWMSIAHLAVTGFGVAWNYSLESKHAAPSSP
jgi:hypothetical protein